MAVIAPGPYPRLLAAGYDSRLRTGAFRFTWTNPYQRGDYFSWVGQILHYGATDDGLYFQSEGPSGDFYLRSWLSGANNWTRPFTWTPGQPVTFTVDAGAGTLTIEGAASGNGTFTGLGMGWRLGDGTLRVGEYAPGVQTLDPMIGLIEDVTVGTVAPATSALTGSGALGAAARIGVRTAGALGGLGVVGAAPSMSAGASTTAALTAALVGLGAPSARVSVAAAALGSGGLTGSLSARRTVLTASAIGGVGTLGGAISAREPSPYVATAFTTIAEYPPGQPVRTNVWPYGQPLLVRDRVGREVICPLRSADQRVYLAVSEDQGTTWRAVGHTPGGADPLWNQNLLTMRQDSSGAYHLLSHDPNEGVVYTRFRLDRGAGNVVVGYTREAVILRVFGEDAATEHVANVVIAKTEAGAECVVLHMQEGAATQMTNYVIRAPNATPTTRAAFTKLDGSPGRDEIAPAGLTHNGHEHISHAAFFESTGSLVFLRAHSAAEGFRNEPGYNDVYRLMATRTGDTWALGAWQREAFPEGTHLRGIAVADARVYLLSPRMTTGLHIDAVLDDGTYVPDAVPSPGMTYPPVAPMFYEADGAVQTSRDGLRLLVYVQSYRSETERAGFFADYAPASGWRRDESVAYAPPWQNYSCCTSTGDGAGLYVARGDGPYGSTVPSLAGFRQLGANISTTEPATAALGAATSLDAAPSETRAAASSLGASSGLAAALGAQVAAAASLGAEGAVVGTLGAAAATGGVAALSAAGTLDGTCTVVAATDGALIGAATRSGAPTLGGAGAVVSVTAALASATVTAALLAARAGAMAAIAGAGALSGASAAGPATVHVSSRIRATVRRWR